MNEPLTAAEAAKILKISTYTLYELIKRGDLPAQKIGRQLRIDPQVLDDYLRGELGAVKPHTLLKQQAGPGQQNFPKTDTPAVHFVGSHDPIVELLFDFLKNSLQPVNSILSFQGSMAGLIALYRHEADFSGIHLWDDKTGEENTPFIHYVLLGEAVCAINLVKREQGLIVAPGNPRKLRDWGDLLQDGLKFVNRQKGSGTRLRLDAYLRNNHISPKRIRGYDQETYTHHEVAYRIANGHADAGIGVRAAAQRLGLGFVPLFQERYDLVCFQAMTQKPVWQQIIGTLQSPGFIQAIHQQAGYDTSLTGQIVYQS